MATPSVDRFLGEISSILRDKDGDKLQSYLLIEPPLPPIYEDLVQEVRRTFPKGQEGRLEEKCSRALPEARDENSPWTAFVKFLVQYFVFLRDVNVQNLLDTYNLLSDLLQRCNSALGHASLGIIVLPTVIAYSRVLARLAIGLDRQPELIAHLKSTTDESGSPETLPERAANMIRNAFTTCLNDRSSTYSLTGPARWDPTSLGKKVGIYTIANLCLKILFQCRKTRNAETIFTNIYNQSPPLSIYPRSQQVTYLYYLGRFMLTQSHFYRAAKCLEAAYSKCHREAFSQRRQILIFLIASNIPLGRFPKEALYQRPEAASLRQYFEPLCRTIAKGDLAAFRVQLDLDASPLLANWLLKHRILLQLRNRCEVLVWRSLIRKLFLLVGNEGDVLQRKAPTLDLHYAMIALRYMEKRADAQIVAATPGGPSSNIHPDFQGIPDLEAEESETIDILETESLVSSLVMQGLLNGYISHKRRMFAITGARQKGVMAAGFPNPAQVILAKCEQEIPGWKQERPNNPFGPRPGAPAAGFGPGMVVNLKGARPVGVGN